MTDIANLLRFWEGVYADRALLCPSTAELVRQTIEALEMLLIKVPDDSTKKGGD